MIKNDVFSVVALQVSFPARAILNETVQRHTLTLPLYNSRFRPNNEVIQPKSEDYSLYANYFLDRQIQRIEELSAL